MDIAKKRHKNTIHPDGSVSRGKTRKETLEDDITQQDYMNVDATENLG